MYNPDNRWKLSGKSDMSLSFQERMVGMEGIPNLLKSNKPEADIFHDGNLLPDMGKTIDRINAALAKKENVCIYGDYDVDGICSVSLLKLAFQKLGSSVLTYIPDRMEEGYGLHKDALIHLKNQGVQLVISVDCGITSVEEAKLAQEINLDLIITDHHKPKERLPEAQAVINPVLPHSLYPNRNLCGAGVAFKLAMLLLKQSPFEVQSLEFLEIAALATVADIMPLTGENRGIVQLGLSSLNSGGRNQGIKALMKICRIKDGNASAKTLGFQIAPRLNATGRIGHGKLGIELLTSQDEEICNQIAINLDQLNQERQEIEKKIYEEAVELVESDHGYLNDKILVVSSQDWHPGVIGIVASRLVERYSKPTIVLSIESETAKGSARSISGFNIFHQLSTCENLLIKFGGHHQAAGVTLQKNNLDRFRKQINIIDDKELSFDDLCKTWNVTTPLHKKELTLKNQHFIHCLEPFGMGNPQPLFLLRGQKIYKPRIVGQDKQHLIGELDDGTRLIAFREASWMDLLNDHNFFDLLVYLEKNEFNGQTTLQLRIADYKINENVVGFWECLDYLRWISWILFKADTTNPLWDIPRSVDPFLEGKRYPKVKILTCSLLQYKKAVNRKSYYGKGASDKYDIEFIPNIALGQRKEYNRIVIYDPLLAMFGYEALKMEYLDPALCFSDEDITLEINFLKKILVMIHTRTSLKEDFLSHLPVHQVVNDLLKKLSTSPMELALILIILESDGKILVKRDGQKIDVIPIKTVEMDYSLINIPLTDTIKRVINSLETVLKR